MNIVAAGFLERAQDKKGKMPPTAIFIAGILDTARTAAKPSADFNGRRLPWKLISPHPVPVTAIQSPYKLHGDRILFADQHFSDTHFSNE